MSPDLTGASPTAPILRGERWRVEHAWPITRAGWLVVVLERHAAALHELTPAEWLELGSVLPRVVTATHEVLGSSKEYVACFAEAPGFEHVHVHVVARLASDDDDTRGLGVFALLNSETTTDLVNLESFCAEMRTLLFA